jgi:DMSO reductase family type II enzyme chaperone
MSGPAATPTPSDESSERSGLSYPWAPEQALCRSALWEALALGFRPPSTETATRLLTREGAVALADAADWLDREHGTALAPLVRRLARPVGLEALTVAYQRCFGHTARGLVPPYETEYGVDSLFQPIHEMSDLAAFYRAFGLTLRGDARERPDHVACECEFLAFLARKEAYVLERGDATLLEGTRQAIRRFLASHLGRWAPAFGRALTKHDRGGFFGDLGRLATAYVCTECHRVGVPAGPEFLRLRTTADPDVPAACGVPTHSEIT